MSVETGQTQRIMNSDLEKLINLQVKDSDIARKEALLKILPDEIKKSYSSAQDAKTALEEFDNTNEANSRLSRDLEAQVEDHKEKIAQSKSKLPTVKTNVEYRALLKEQDNFEKKIVQLEEKQLELMEILESDSGARGSLEKVYNEEEGKFKIIQKEKEAAIEEVKAALERLIEERQGIIDGITPDIYANYEKVMRARDGIGVARIADMLCQGCNQTIPPREYYEIKSSDKIHQCPHCSRFLYYEAEKTDSEET
ncbi:hypothetical protein MNBD_NITROSPINAE02-629 [hydrothermal vent metagenome]|uniref:Uncharacterized protein n=1 Tax=hydrothermal vent metagenome TaxID=652676 RepID=A0A3B1CGP0_9ZZZZ